MSVITALRRDGIAPALGNLTEAEAAETRAYFATRLTIAAHVDSHADWCDRTLRPLASTQALGVAHACYLMQDTLAAPNLLRHALAHVDLAAEYLGCEPVLYSVNCWVSFVSGPVRPDTQALHRDADDSNFLALFTLLLPTPISAAHCYVTGSHETTTAAPAIGPGDEIVQVCGPAGTSFLAATKGFHMSRKPTEGPRMITWARFGVSDPPASYMWDKIQPVECDVALTERERRVCRLVIR